MVKHTWFFIDDLFTAKDPFEARVFLDGKIIKFGDLRIDVLGEIMADIELETPPVH